MSEFLINPRMILPSEKEQITHRFILIPPTEFPNLQTLPNALHLHTQY